MKERIIEKLEKNLSVRNLSVVNKSHLHSGHKESSGSGKTHFEVTISAIEFENQSLVLSHRKIKNLLKEEFEKEGLHSLSIKIIK